MQDKGRSRLYKAMISLLLGFFLVFLALVFYLLILAIDHPPEVEDFSGMQTKRIQYGQHTYILGDNWLRRSESGLWEAYIEGKPFERGLAFGRLTRELLYYQETSFVEQIRELVPSDAYLKFLKYFIAFFNRNLDKHIPAEYLYEIYGTSLSCSREYDYIGSGYQRQLNYHAAHDIGHALQGLNMVGCTSFSVWDGASVDSSLLVGRNFDFYMGSQFAENKIVCFVNPAEGHKFMMITWADMIGVVSGMNEKGLTVTLNAAKSGLPGQAAVPVTLLAREILQYASTIEEAFQISKRRKLFVSESIMIGSAYDRKTAIIEKTPDQYDLVYPDSNSIICTNHYQGKEFAQDRINLDNIYGSDSYARFLRVKELTSGNLLDVSRVAAILRDQHGLGNTDIGMGNQLSINQLIAHHAVVFKPDSLLAWVSAGPWQLGEFVAYDLKKVFDLDAGHIQLNNEICETSRAIPADSFLMTSAYKRFREYQSMTRELIILTKNRKQLPAGFESNYCHTNPSLYMTYVRLAEYFENLKAHDKAIFYYREAMKRKLPGKDEENRLMEKTNNLVKKTRT
jgi:hypothetical protein